MSREETPETRVLPGLIRKFFPSAQVFIYPVAGAAVLEVIDGSATPERATKFSASLFQQMGDYNQRLAPELRAKEGVSVHRLCIYASRIERYAGKATLRTIPSGYNQEGSWTSTLAVNDAFILMAEAEVEALLLGIEFPFVCTGIADPMTKGGVFAPSIHNATLYRGLDVEGHSFSVHSFTRGQMPGEWQFTVA